LNKIRLIIDPPMSGVTNMARDEALLSLAAKTGNTTLRFYQWEEPTVSLGYFQSHRDREHHETSLHCPWVRRATGGGAIVHANELTYSFVVPTSNQLPGAAPWCYEQFHQTFVKAISDRIELTRCQTTQKQTPEPFLCFQRRYENDVLASYESEGQSTAKVMGSAQRRRDGALLQHGSILLSRCDEAPELVGVNDLATSFPDELNPSDLISAWSPELEETLKCSLVDTQFSIREAEIAKKFEVERFANSRWNEKR